MNLLIASLVRATPLLVTGMAVALWHPTSTVAALPLIPVAAGHLVQGPLQETAPTYPQSDPIAAAARRSAE